MRQIGEIMEEMGFDKKSSESTQAAFLKHLFKKAYGVEVELPKKYQQNEKDGKQLNLFELPEKKRGA